MELNFKNSINTFANVKIYLGFGKSAMLHSLNNYQIGEGIILLNVIYIITTT